MAKPPKQIPAHHVEMPDELPKGVTKRQWRLAALLPRCETAAEAMRQAGYGELTIDKMSRPILGTLGVRHARDVQKRGQLDSARGLMGVGTAALATVKADLEQLDPRDRIGVGLKATELAHQLGENMEQQGDGNRFHERVRRACRFMARLTYLRLTSTTSCVCGCHNQATVAKERNDDLY